MPAAPTPKLQQICAVAHQYRVSPRTAHRWLAAGVNVTNPLEVASHLASCRAPARAAIEAAITVLTIELSKLNL